MKAQKLEQLEVANFKKINRLNVKFTPEGGLLFIAGKNGAGKTSAFQAIEAALGGGRALEHHPLKDGAKAGFAKVTLSDLVVVKVFKEGGKASLKVTNKDGFKADKPQELLNKLRSALTFDPLAFEKMDKRARAKLLLELAGLDTNCQVIAEKRVKVFEERSFANRQVQEKQGYVSGLDEPEEGLPDVEESVTDLAQRLRNAEAQAQENTDKRGRVAALALKIIQMKEHEAELIRELESHQGLIIEAKAECKSKSEESAALVDPPIKELEERLANAESTNAKIRAAKGYLAAQDELRELTKKANTMTDRIKELDREKDVLLGNAKFPVEGLNLKEGEVYYKNVPYDEECKSSRTRIALAIGMDLNPDWKFIRIEDGNGMDKETLEMVAEMAQAKDYQVWIEWVGTPDQQPALILEDGNQCQK
jgi:predicted ATP-dependent endonuclease of OLD family